MKNYLNIVIQLLNVIVALIPNLVFPLIFGLHFHGQFLIIIALPTFAAYLVSLPYDNLLLKELATRSELGLGTCIRKLLWQKLALINLLFLAISAWQPSAEIILQLLFINSTGFSSFFLSALYADNHKQRIVSFLFGFILISLTTALFVFIAGLEVRSLVIAVIVVNISGGLIAILFLRERWYLTEPIDIHPLRIFRFIGLTSALGTLSYGVVALAGAFLPAERLSLLRIAISVAQAATSFFPVNQRTILENIIFLSGKNNGTAEVTRYLSAAFSLIALMALGVCGLFLVIQILVETGFAPDFVASAFVQYKWELIIMAPAVSLFLLASIMEKVIIGMLSETRGLLYGLVATLLIVAGAVICMLYATAGGFAAYTLSSVFVVAVAITLLAPSYGAILRPVSLLLVVIALSVALTIWAIPGGAFTISALLALTIVIILFVAHLWKNSCDNLLDFIQH